MAAEGEFPKTDGDILYASEINAIEGNKYYPLSSPVPSGGNSFIVHSSTVWGLFVGTASVRTTDAGVTWVALSTDDTDMRQNAHLCDADSTKAFVCDLDSNEINYTTDSGDNYTNATTSPALVTNVLTGSFPTATVAVVGCIIGSAARSIFRSTDGGDTWTICTTGPAVNTVAMDMVDGSDGIAIDTNGNIWTTADGGDNWTDSGQNVNSTSNTSNLLALTSSTGIYVSRNPDNTLETFTTGAGGTARLHLVSLNTNGNWPSNLVKATNGNIYFVTYIGSGDARNAFSLFLYKSVDNGVTWEVATIGDAGMGNYMGDNNYGESMLWEYDTNQLALLASQNHVMTIDCRGDLTT
jgi:photosystem II stability/assembly factor-like uncharacterized protein